MRLSAEKTITWHGTDVPASVTFEKIYFGPDPVGLGGFQVAVATCSSAPPRQLLRDLFLGRKGKTQIQLVVAVVHDRTVHLFGPDPQAKPIELPLERAQRQLQSVLAEPDVLAATERYAGLRKSSDATGAAGFTNSGLFASHHITSNVPKRSDWSSLGHQAVPLLSKRGKQLIEALGFGTQPGPNGTMLLSISGHPPRAVAVLLDDSEQFDAKTQRFQLSPVAFGLAVASRQDVPWLIVLRKDQIRLYPGRDGIGVGAKGQAETYFEIDLATVDAEYAALLPLVFSAQALAAEGTADELLRDSARYATELGARLRERIYDEVVPPLAVEVAHRLAKSAGVALDAEGLALSYRVTLRILFRLLFQAYAEDRGLLPAGRNEGFDANSLKTNARRLIDSTEFGPASTIWFDLVQVWNAIDQGNPQWQIPAYNGGLFSTDTDRAPEGALIKKIELPDSVLGPALKSLLIDVTGDSVLGPVDFRSLSVREFGTIYEGLLESDLSVAEQSLTLGKDATYLPAKEGDTVVVPAGDVYLHNKSGQRKATGSYFTKPFAVDHLLDHALVPTLDEHLARVAELVETEREADAAAALFDFRVADISMGSGHFLTAVVDRIEAQISSFLAEHPIPQVTAELNDLRQHATKALGDNAAGVEIENASLLRRLIARRCVYGVDLNPISVELARVSMWIHTFVPGLPLSFLNHNLAVGDSLSGIATIEEAAAAMSKVDGVQVSMFNDPLRVALADAEEPLQRLARLVDATPKDIVAARETEQAVKAAVEPVAAFFDVTVAVRTKQRAAPVITSPEDLFKLRDDDSRSVAKELGSLHFPVAFPEVFLRERPGFDVIVGNPPWNKVKVDEHVFWSRHFPGFRGNSQSVREALVAQYKEERPDLVEVLEAERRAADSLKLIVRSGSYLLGSGDTELARVFAWRFWALLRDGGRFGVVMPRQPLLAAPGATAWRDRILAEGEFEDISILENKSEWVFDDVDGRYTVGLITVRKGAGGSVIRLSGPHRSVAELDAARAKGAESLTIAEFRTWGDDLAFPTLNEPTDFSIYRAMLPHPTFGGARSDWHFRPVRETDATNDKHLFVFSEQKPVGVWPVYKGESFNLWQPEGGPIYAWAKSETIRGHLFEKRQNQARIMSSAFYGLTKSVLVDESTLSALQPRIAYRWVTNSTNQRSLICALVPPAITLQNGAPYFERVRADEFDEAYVLGVMSTRILDWFARKIVELNMTFTVINSLPIPEAVKSHPGRQRITELAGRLAAIDERYTEWARAIGVDYGPVPEDQAEDMKAELDACVARLFGLDEQQIRDLYATFHPTWDHEPWTERVLEHYRRITWDPAEVPA